MPSVAEIVGSLVEYPVEHDWFEFKRNWDDPQKIGEYISSLSNAAALRGREAGYLVWGVDDATHEVVGTGVDWNVGVGRKGHEEPLEHWLARQVSPDLAFRFDEGELRGGRVVLLTVPAARKVPTSFAGVRYGRIGSSKVSLTKYPDREAELFSVLRNGVPSIVNTPAEVQGLSFARLFTYYAGRGVELRSDTFAENLNLLLPDGRWNMMAQLLSDDSRMPVRVSVFQGKTKTAPLYSVREFGNTCLLISLDRMLDYIDVVNVVQADERNRVVERKDVPLLDPKAVREAVINAFVHNLWVGGNAPMFTVYSDRLEILSHGEMAPGQTVEGFFRGVSVPVNDKLSDIFIQLHISERSGRGVPKVVEAYGRGAYEFADGMIVLTMPFNRVGGEGDDSAAKAPDAGLGRVESAWRTRLNETQEGVLLALRDDPNATHERIALEVGKSVATVERALRFLREAGYIERVGSNKSGWWRVL